MFKILSNINLFNTKNIIVYDMLSGYIKWNASHSTCGHIIWVIAVEIQMDHCCVVMIACSLGSVSDHDLYNTQDGYKPADNPPEKKGSETKW